MSYSTKLKNNVSSQTIIVTSDNYTLSEDYSSVRVNLPYPIEIPSIGSSTIQLQKVFFSSIDILPATTDFLFIYLSNDIGLSNKVVCESSLSTQLIGTVPVVSGGAQYYLADNDSNILQELWDNQRFQSFTITILNREGTPVKFADNLKPYLQFAILTDYTEKKYDNGLLRVEQEYRNRR